jgi:hypothetical protein
MLRQFAITALCLCLLGCGSIRWFEARNTDKPQVAVQRDDSCGAVARQRAQDAAYNGYDRDMQERIYKDSYNECVAGRKQSDR